MGKFYRAGQVTDGNITECMCLACWATKAANERSEFVILLFRRKMVKRILRNAIVYVYCLSFS